MRHLQCVDVTDHPQKSNPPPPVSHTPFRCVVIGHLAQFFILWVQSNMLPLKCQITPLKPSGHYVYHQFNIQQFYVLPTQYIYVFCVDLRKNSDYFPTQH